MQGNTGNHGGGVFASGSNRASEPKKATKHHWGQRNAENRLEKRPAKLWSRKIITKTAHAGRGQTTHMGNVGLNDLEVCPTLFQEFINKAYDVRITVVDEDIHAVALSAEDGIGSQRCDIRRNNMSDVTYSKIELPDVVRACIVRLMARYGLRFAAIDMAVSVAGEWFFFEVNPNGQWAWLDTSAGTSIAESFVKSFSAVSEKEITQP